MTTVNDRLTEFIEYVFDTLTEASRVLELNSGTLYNITKGGRDPRAESMRRFGKFGCNLHWLVTGEGEMFADTTAGNTLRLETEQKHLESNQSKNAYNRLLAKASRARSGRTGSVRISQEQKTTALSPSFHRPEPVQRPEPDKLPPVSAGVTRAGKIEKGYTPIDLAELVSPNTTAAVVMRYNGNGLPKFGIQQGDWLVIDREEPAVSGSLVVARTHRKPANVYRLDHHKDRVLLIDGINEEEADISGQTYRIDGVVITVLRRYRQTDEQKQGTQKGGTQKDEKEENRTVPILHEHKPTGQ